MAVGIASSNSTCPLPAVVAVLSLVHTGCAVPTFFRIVLTDPPTRYDFLSDKDRGKPKPHDPELTPLWEGLSVMDTFERAAQMALRFPTNGGYISAVDIPDDGSVSYKRTLRRQGHHTIWGDAELLLKCVAWTRPAGVAGP